MTVDIICDACGEAKQGVRLYDCYDGTISRSHMLLCPDCAEAQREAGEAIPQNYRRIKTWRHKNENP